MCKTTDLITLIYEKSASKPVPAAPTKGKKVAEAKEEKAKECACTNEGVDTKARAALSRLVTILADNCTLEDWEAEEIKDILSVKGATSEDYKPSSASSYSDDEIDKMFDFAR